MALHERLDGRAFGTVLAALALLSMAACVPHLEKPDVAVLGVERQSVQRQEQHFVVHLRVTNPNAQSIPVEGMSYVVTINGTEVARGDSDQKVTVPGRGSADVDLPLTTDLRAGLATVIDLLVRGGDSLDYRVMGTARTGITFFHSIPFDQRGSVSLAGR